MDKVVQVSAQRDYEGTVWTDMFSSVEKAFEAMRDEPADTFAGVDGVVVAWVGVDRDYYERVADVAVDFKWGEDGESDTVEFRTWGTKTEESKTFSF